MTDNSTDNSGQNNSSTVTPTADSNNQVGQGGNASNTGDNTSTEGALVAQTSSAYSGLAIAINGMPGFGFNWFAVNDNNRAWLHLKLAVVVLAILPVHGLVRARVKRFGQGKIAPVKQNLYTVKIGI